MEIVLASRSPRRSALLAEWGIPFRAIPAQDVDESGPAGAAAEVATALALEKARSVLAAMSKAGEARPGLVVIGADTVVEAGGGILGKPGDRSDARAMLEVLSGRSHRVHTGVAVCAEGGAEQAEVETSEVIFHPLSSREIEEYLDTGDAEGKAGAYGIQSEGRRLVAGFRGCYYNIVGLPMRRLIRMLRRAAPGGAEEAAAPFLARAECDCEGQALWRGGSGCGRSPPGA